MKKLLLLFSFCIFTFCNLNSLKAQNLIQNGDFEQGYDTSTGQWMYPLYYNCIANTNETVIGLDFWTVTIGEPGRFVYGSPFFNCYDNIISHSGVAHVGFNGNDGGQTVLINPLIAGNEYKLEYYACLDSMWFVYDTSQGFTPNTWIKFSFNNGGNIFNSPLITYTGYGDWIKYDTFFTAQSNSTIFKFQGNNQSPHVIYMDDISLEEDSTADAIKGNYNSESINISPNPATAQLHISAENLNDYSLKIYTVTGQLVMQAGKLKGNSDIDIAALPRGVYLLQALAGDRVFNKKLIVE